MFKKMFPIPYEDVSNYPSPTAAMEAIRKYCEESGESCTFTGDDEVEISGVKYEVQRRASPLDCGYGIWCAEK